MSDDQAKQTDGVPSYLGQLTQAPLLGAAEEAALARAARDGCQDSRRRLVESNMRLVINIARTYHSKTVPLEDLIQEGAIGLMQAVERFDPDRGFRFSTYATHWIRQAIGRAIDNKAKTIRLPAHISQTLRKVERTKQELAKELGQEPTMEQIARVLEMPAHRLSHMIQMNLELLSLDQKVGEGDSTSFGSLLRDRSSADPAEAAIDQEKLRELNDLLETLDEREIRILAYRLRTEERAESKAEIVEDLDLSPKRLREMEAQVIRKLRHIAQVRRLRELLGD
ncbi:MAG: RNA polymerase sigma factor RpoD/SigA [Fimbriimonadaceae bacterium]|nr:RNA polymerase sigma factor RpoD/SigA [Fimbriimonadaceae bacterium]